MVVVVEIAGTVVEDGIVEVEDVVVVATTVVVVVVTTLLVTFSL
jgi:hypothetical protein